MDGAEIPNKGIDRRQLLAGAVGLGAAALVIGNSAKSQEATGEEIFAKEPGTLEERKLLARQLVERMQSFPENEGTWSKKLQIGSADVAIDITRQDRDGSLIISINGNSDIGSIGPSFHIRDWDVTGEVSFAPLSMQGTKFEFEVTKEKQDPRHLDLARRLYKGILEAILAQF